MEREDTKTLNRIYHVNATITMTDLTNCLNRRPVSGQELDEADGEQAGSAGGCVDAVEGVADGEPRDGNALFFEPLPGKIVGREFFAEGYNAVAGTPVQADGDRSDPLRCVFH